MRNKKISIIVAVFLCALSAYILYTLKDIAKETAYVYFVPEDVKRIHALDIEAERALMEKTRLIAERLEYYATAKRYEVKAKHEEQRQLRLHTFWWGMGASVVFGSFGILLFIGAAAHKLSTSNPETLAIVAMSIRKRTPEEFNVMREQLRFGIAELKYANQHPGRIIDATEPIAIDAAQVKTAAECLDLSYITQEGGRFLWGFDNAEQPVFMTLKKDGFKAAIIGMPEQGKTFKMVTLAAQAFYKGWQGIIIDLHSNADRSLYQYLTAFTGLKSLYWCTDPDDVNDTLDMILAEHDRRLRGGSYTPLLIMIDDALSIGNSAEYEARFETFAFKMATEGSKVGESLIVASHNWQSDSMPKQFRSNFNWRCAFRCDASESHLLFQDKRGKHSGLTPDLKPGSCVLLDNTKDVHTLQGPLWDTHTLQRMADTAKDAPPIREAFEVPQELFRGLHVVDGGKRA